MIFLLDVNVLLAMRYGVHVHNERVQQWVSRLPADYGNDRTIFATCPITELGFVRVGSGKAAYAESLDAARDDLEKLKSRMGMLFIPTRSPRATFRRGFASLSRRQTAICWHWRNLTTAVLQRWIDAFRVPCSFPRKRRGRSWCGNLRIRSCGARLRESNCVS